MQNIRFNKIYDVCNFYKYLHKYNLLNLFNICLYSCCDLCEEWYHGDCIHITEKEAKLIKKYFCEKCKEDDPTLRTIFRSTSQILPNSVVATEKAVVPEKKPKVEKVVKVGTSSNRCYKCDGCRAKNCGKCSACLNRNKRSAHKQRCKKRICIYQVKKKEKEGRIK